jgi:hypothetical protein
MDDQTAPKEKDPIEEMVKGLRATLQETDRLNAPAASGVRSLVAALEQLLEGEEHPIRSLLGLVNARPGLPGRSDVEKLKALRKYENLLALGKSPEDAASDAGASLRAISRWRNEPVGFAERVDAMLNEEGQPHGSGADQDTTQG